MTRRRITAVELDTALAKLGDALAALTPEERDALCADMPTDIVALGDQAGAAQGQAIGLFLDAGDRGGYVPRDQVDEWIRLSALDVLITWMDGKGRTCMQAPHYRRPEPVFSCAWRPGLVVCASCLHLLDTVERCGQDL